jgi:hypothetical protein
MTYEPGQQVLVWGVNCDLSFDRRYGCVVIANQHVRNAAADVVGPAPATPDESADVAAIRVRWNDMPRSIAREDVRYLLDALAAAGARIAAALELHPKIEDPRHGCCAHPKLCDGHSPECGGKDHGINRPDWPCQTVHALSVEATGTEGGGGHE